MTRDEARRTVQSLETWMEYGSAAALAHVDALVALGLLKLDDPMSVEDEACAVLNRIIGPIQASMVLDRLHFTGFKIVKA